MLDTDVSPQPRAAIAAAWTQCAGSAEDFRRRALAALDCLGDGEMAAAFDALVQQSPWVAPGSTPELDRLRDAIRAADHDARLVAWLSLELAAAMLHAPGYPLSELQAVGEPLARSIRYYQNVGSDVGVALAELHNGHVHLAIARRENSSESLVTAAESYQESAGSFDRAGYSLEAARAELFQGHALHLLASRSPNHPGAGRSAVVLRSARSRLASLKQWRLWFEASSQLGAELMRIGRAGDVEGYREAAAVYEQASTSSPSALVGKRERTETVVNMANALLGVASSHGGAEAWSACVAGYRSAVASAAVPRPATLVGLASALVGLAQAQRTAAPAKEATELLREVLRALPPEVVHSYFAATARVRLALTSITLATLSEGASDREAAHEAVREAFREAVPVLGRQDPLVTQLIFATADHSDMKPAQPLAH